MKIKQGCSGRLTTMPRETIAHAIKGELGMVWERGSSTHTFHEKLLAQDGHLFNMHKNLHFTCKRGGNFRGETNLKGMFCGFRHLRLATGSCKAPPPTNKKRKTTLVPSRFLASKQSSEGTQKANRTPEIKDDHQGYWGWVTIQYRFIHTLEYLRLL